MFKAGDECTDVTGGWSARGWKVKDNYTAKTPTLTKNTESMLVTLSSSSSQTYISGVVEVNEDVDLTNFNTLYIEYDTLGSPESDAYSNIYVVDRNKTYTSDGKLASHQIENNVERRIESLDIKGISGAYDIAVGLRCILDSTKMIVSVYNIWLE